MGLITKHPCTPEEVEKHLEVSRFSGALGAKDNDPSRIIDSAEIGMVSGDRGYFTGRGFFVLTKRLSGPGGILRKKMLGTVDFNKELAGKTGSITLVELPDGYLEGVSLLRGVKENSSRALDTSDEEFDALNTEEFCVKAASKAVYEHLRLIPEVEATGMWNSMYQQMAQEAT